MIVVFTGGPVVKIPYFHYRQCRLDPWSGKFHLLCCSAQKKKKRKKWDFPSCPVVENLPANPQDTDPTCLGATKPMYHNY